MKDAARAYRVYATNTNDTGEDDMEYLVDHSIVIYLVGPDGKFLDFYTQLSEPDEVEARIAKVLTSAGFQRQP